MSERSGAPVAGAAAAQIEAANAVNKVGALGTYLANMQDDATRERYTHLTWELDKVVREASRIPPADLNKRFEPADRDVRRDEQRLREDRKDENVRGPAPCHLRGSADVEHDG